MREILFKGKRLDNGEWVYGAYVPDALVAIGNGEYVTWGFIRRYDPVLGKPEMHEIDLSTLGQCTGLVDKHGKAIFEGDVVEWDGQSMDTYKIIYGDDASFFGVPINGRFEQIAGASLSLLNADLSIVVIGTIHDITPDNGEG